MAKKRNEIPPNLPMPSEEDLRLPPADEQTEKFCLGSALVNPEHLAAVAAVPAEYFSTEAHRRVHARMKEMHERAEVVDRVTLANELRKFGQLESVGGITALLALDEGLPNLPQIDSYLGILRDFAGRRKLIQLGLLVSESAYRGEQAPAEILAGAEEAWRTIEASGTPETDGGQTAIEVIENFPGGVSAFLDPSQRVRGLPTGFAKYDEMTGGMRGGEVTVLAARTSNGKTALALNVAEHLALHPKQRRFVGIFSLEMSAESLILRMACSRSRVDMHKFRAGYLNADERHKLQVAIHEITEARIRFYEEGATSIAKISKAIRKQVDEGMHFAVIDYLQLIEPPRGTNENRNQEIGKMSRQIKLLSREVNIPIMLLSQLSRQGDRRTDPQPQLSDLRDSGEIEQNADVVAFIFRPELYKREREDLRGVAELIIAKQRNGPLGAAHLRFMGQFVRFENRSDDLPEE